LPVKPGYRIGAKPGKASGSLCWPGCGGGLAQGLGWADNREGKMSAGLWTKEKEKGRIPSNSCRIADMQSLCAATITSCAYDISPCALTESSSIFCNID
jgi:hypothetical protein